MEFLVGDRVRWQQKHCGVTDDGTVVEVNDKLVYIVWDYEVTGLVHPYQISLIEPYCKVISDVTWNDFQDKIKDRLGVN